MIERPLPLVSLLRTSCIQLTYILIAGVDYTAVYGTSLTFSSGASRTQSFEVPIINDNITELQETVVLRLASAAVVMKSGVQLSLTHQERTRIVFGAVIGSITINDDDCKPDNLVG